MRLPKYLGCFDRRLLIELIPTIVVMAGTLFTIRLFERGSTARSVLLVLTALATAYALLVVVASLRRLDELQQRVHFIAITAAFAVTGMVVTSWPLLQKAGLPLPALGSWLWFLMSGVWLVGMLVVGRRYR